MSNVWIPLNTDGGNMAFSSSAAQYNYFKEKRILQEEEKALKEMLNKFQDQLNRLKIEELALITMMKLKAESDETGAPWADKKSKVAADDQSFDSISDMASTSSMVPVGLMYEDVGRINEEQLDLKVCKEEKDRMDDFEEEEEEDDDDEDEMEDNIISLDEDYRDPLRSYMDGI